MLADYNVSGAQLAELQQSRVIELASFCESGVSDFYPKATSMTIVAAIGCLLSRHKWAFATTAIVATLVPVGSGEAQPRFNVPAPEAGAPHVFGTIALPLKSTRFDDRWQHVLRSGASAGQLAPLIGAARQAPKIKQLRLVNASLNERIRYRHDTGPSGDRWSTARETLSRSTGDCEDYAIAKLHALKALGVPERDLFMTIGHDGYAGAVHAVLVARSGNRFFVLDNRINRLIPHEEYGGFYPMITFGSRASWLHGYEQGKTPAAVKAIRVALQSNRDLPLGNSRGSAETREVRP